ncbi:hypothetical protein LCGC14_2539140, partial [marine sediment metagenome]
VQLMSIGQSPVNTLTDTGIKDVEIARLILHNTSREIQDESWEWNTDYAYEISPDGNDRILVPSNCLSIDPTSRADDWVQRYDSANSAQSMYDLNEQTFERTKVLKVDIVWFYSFEQLPNSARNYIAQLAGQKFQAKHVSSELLFKFEENDVQRARAILMRNSHRVRDRNLLVGGDFTNVIFHRRRNP